MDWTRFRQAPIEIVREVAPRTVLVCGAGTRREAMLCGIHPNSLKAYFRWGLLISFEHHQRWFDHGVRDLFICLIRSSQARESATYGRGLIPETIELFEEFVHIWSQSPPPFALRTFGDTDFPELSQVLARLCEVSARPNVPRLWWSFAASPDSPYRHALAAINGRNARTQAEAIAAIYGPDVEPCRMYIGFGKPLLTAELQLPFLIDEAQAMWYQAPGYSGLTATMIRRMIYEAVYVRRTWMEDKDQRYETVLAQRAIWEQPLVLGFGQKMDGFWYPASDILFQEEQL
jgi:hypothetical protein